MRHLISKRDRPYKTCTSCGETFPNNEIHFKIIHSQPEDYTGLPYLSAKCETNKCRSNHKFDYEQRKRQQHYFKDISKYGFDVKYENYMQMIAVIGHKITPYFDTEEDMEYKAPSYEEIRKEYRL